MALILDIRNLAQIAGLSPNRIDSTAVNHEGKDDTHGFFLLDTKADILEHIISSRVIPETDIFEFDIPVPDRSGLIRLPDCCRGGKDLGDSFGRGLGAGKIDHYINEHGEREGNLHQIVDKGHQFPGPGSFAV